MFEVMTIENSQQITLNDNQGVKPMECMIIGQGTKAIAWAVIAYSKMYNVCISRVGYSVQPCSKI